MRKTIAAILIALTSLSVTACGSSSEDDVEDPATSTVEATVTTSTKSEAEKKEELRERLDSMLPINQINEGNLRDACIMAIHDEIPGAGDYDFPTPIDMGDPDSAGIYSDGGTFRYENEYDNWEEAAYFCTIYTKNGAISESSAVVTG